MLISLHAQLQSSDACLSKTYPRIVCDKICLLTVIKVFLNIARCIQVVVSDTIVNATIVQETVSVFRTIIGIVLGANVAERKLLVVIEKAKVPHDVAKDKCDDSNETMKLANAL